MAKRGTRCGVLEIIQALTVQALVVKLVVVLQDLVIVVLLVVASKLVVVVVVVLVVVVVVVVVLGKSIVVAILRKSPKLHQVWLRNGNSHRVLRSWGAVTREGGGGEFVVLRTSLSKKVRGVLGCVISHACAWEKV